MVNQLPPPPEKSGLPAVDPSSHALAGRTPDYLERVPAEPDRSRQYRRYIDALWRYGWFILLVTIIGVAAGALAGRFVRLTYEVQATIWIEENQTRGGNQRQDDGPIQPERLLGSDGWVDLFKTFTVLDPAVEQLRLYLNTAHDRRVFDVFQLTSELAPGLYKLTVDQSGREMVLTAGQHVELERAAVGDTIGRSIGVVWVPTASALKAGQVIDFQLTTPRDAALRLANRLDVRADRNGKFIRVELTGGNRRKITETVNVVSERYVEVVGELRRAKFTERAAILAEQRRAAQDNLRQAELALQNFKVETITLPSQALASTGLQDNEDPVFDNFFNLRVERQHIRRDREAIERALATASPTSGVSTDALEVIETVQNSSIMDAVLQELSDKQASLRAIRYRYTDDYPPVVRLQGEVDSLAKVLIPAIAMGLINEVKVREAALDRQIQSESQELRAIPPRAIEEARLERDVAAATELFTGLDSDYQQTRLAEAGTIPDVRLFDRALVPERPLKQRQGQFLFMGLLGGLGLGVLGALVLDRFDRRVRYPEQVTSEMGLTILGTVPHLRSSGNGATANSTAPVVEALRAVRLNLIHAYGAAGPLVVTITSPGPGDGKTFVASNLALAFADAGHRTILVDGDVRRGKLHDVLGSTRKPGLTDALTNSLSVSDVVQQTEYRGLSFLPCGTRTTGAPELLSSPAMSELLASLRSQYGVVIVDSPPLGAGVDAFSLGTMTGHILLILRTGLTDREMAEAKLDVIDRLPIRIVGAVLNGIRGGGVYKYYSYYLPGYEYEPEGKDGGTRRLLESAR